MYCRIRLIRVIRSPMTRGSAPEKGECSASRIGRCDCTGNDSMTKGEDRTHTVRQMAPARRPKDDESTRSIIGGFYAVYTELGYGLVESL